MTERYDCGFHSCDCERIETMKTSVHYQCLLAAEGCAIVVGYTGLSTEIRSAGKYSAWLVWYNMSW